MVLKRIVQPFCLAVVSLFFLSCGLLEPGSSVLRGNYLYQQGRYQNALLLFLQGEETGKYDSRIRYNIGNVYYALGEGPAALEIWNGIDETRDPVVAFNTIFNRGVIFYQTSRYLEAYTAFRTALEMNPGNLDAKRNLELTIDRMEVEARSSESRSDSSVPEAGDDARRILQYIRRKEGNVWKNDSAPFSDVMDW